MSVSTRVIKNTGYLYIKMGITMFVSLYSTRLILASLGESDFGIFNVIGGAIAMLGFLNSTLANATQRFMSYAEGEGFVEKKRRIFNVSLVLHFVIAGVTVLLLLFAMIPLFNAFLNIEPDRIHAAKIVYYCLIFSTFMSIINVPYDAIMNAHENMLYYSVVGVFDSLLRLCIAFICVYASGDRLVIYGILIACIPIITLSIMKLYCHKHYDECVIAPRKYWDRNIVRQISGFFGWNFLTAISSLFSAQGIGIILNHFFGSRLNAAQGVANQVSGSLSNFSGNMMKALNPVIVKNAGARKTEAMNRATIIGCKFSTLLTLVFAVPVSLEIDYLLGIWLKDVPSWATVFCIMQLVISVITQMANSASTAVYAQGDIKHYAIWKSVMNSLPLLLTWLAFLLGGGPIWLYVPMIVIWSIGGDAVILYYAKHKCGLQIDFYVKSVLLPLLSISLLMFLFGLFPIILLQQGIVRLIITCLITTIGMILATILFGLSKEEKSLLADFISGMIKRKQRQ